MVSFTQHKTKCFKCGKEYDTFYGIDDMGIKFELLERMMMIPLCKECSKDVRDFLGVTEHSCMAHLTAMREAEEAEKKAEKERRDKENSQTDSFSGPIGVTDNPDDPRLGHGPADEAPVPQNDVYLVLSEEERRKGFVRPYRDKYIHVGIGGHEIDPKDPRKSGLVAPGCGAETKMGTALSETYARDPYFYGLTYCVGCKMHRPVAEFIWDKDGEVVGS